jgi:hypothetical protein
MILRISVERERGADTCSVWMEIGDDLLRQSPGFFYEVYLEKALEELREAAIERGIA